MKKAEFEALKARAYQLNRERAVDKAKASDMDIIVAEIMKLPYGQLKKVLTEPVLEVLAKYGYAGEVSE